MRRRLLFVACCEQSYLNNLVYSRLRRAFHHGCADVHARMCMCFVLFVRVKNVEYPCALLQEGCDHNVFRCGTLGGRVYQYKITSGRCWLSPIKENLGMRPRDVVYHGWGGGGVARYG